MEFFNKQVEEHLKELDLESDLPPTDFVQVSFEGNFLKFNNYSKL